MSSLSEKVQEAKNIYNRALEEHDPRVEYAMFSGGNDSIVSTWFMMEECNADAVLHLDTGIGIPETQEYIEDVCDRLGWDLEIYAARDYVRGDGEPDPQKYEELVKEQGFPGPPHHYKMYQRLKERPMLKAVREAKEEWGDRILLGTGRYKAESKRRVQLEDEPIDRTGARLWVNPMFYWKPSHFDEYREDRDLPTNPVSDKICMSGECLCGAYARKGELSEIAAFYPETAQRILELQEEVYEAGFDWGWEEGPVDAEDREEPPGNDEAHQLCSNCIGKEQRNQKGAQEALDSIRIDTSGDDE